MTPKQTLELRQGEIRRRLAELGIADGTDETRSEIETLGVEYRTNDGKITALVIAADTPVETRTADHQRHELHQRASVGALVHALLNGRSGVDGAMAELQTEYGLAANELHVRQLSEWGGVETRAVTPGATNVGQDQQPIIPYVFPDSVAAFLGVDIPTVPVGDAVFPVLTSELSVGTPAENAAQAETTGAFSADVLQPGRLQASFFYSREDRARFNGMDASLRENLSMGLADGLDKAIIAGTNGLLTGANLTAHNVTAATTFALYLSQFVGGRVDGRYASDYPDLRLVLGQAAFSDADATYRADESDVSALDRIRGKVGGVRVSAHVPAADNNNRQNQIIRLGLRRDMVAPVWENVALIPDEVTKAANGQIMLTAVMLHAVKILRAAGFYKQMVQTA